MKRLLFVCLGNICRSPLAQGAFEAAVARAGLLGSLAADSAGMIDFHEGKAPDRRGQAAAGRAGLDISDQRSRPVRPEDFDQFDHILAMDSDNLSDLEHMAQRIGYNVADDQTGAVPKLSLFLPHAPDLGMTDLPDPYYGTDRDFDRVLDAATRAADQLLDKIRKDYA